jgi:starvation-inducible outer membrane lipoprotein
MSQGNRQARRAWAAARKKHIQRGNVYHVEIQHDADCLIYSTERTCTCNPDRVLKDDRGRVLARVEGAGFYDPMELCGVPA